MPMARWDRLGGYVLGDYRSRYQRLQIDIDKNPLIKDNIVFSSLEMYFEFASRDYLEALLDNDVVEWGLKTVSTKTLLDFLLDNKKESRKDNTRDFLILSNLISLAKKKTEDLVIFISHDKIFFGNSFFDKYVSRRRIENLRFYNSIGDFLQEFGPQFEFLTIEYLTALIPVNSIKEKVIDEALYLLQFISRFYLKKKIRIERQNLEEIRFDQFEIDNFYVYKDYLNQDIKVNLKIAVKVFALFEPEEEQQQLSEHLKLYGDLESSVRIYFISESFDEELRPFYDDWLLISFEGIVDPINNEIKGLKLLEIDPVEFRYRKWNRNFEKRFGRRR